jgi:hypothetical protein
MRPIRDHGHDAIVAHADQNVGLVVNGSFHGGGLFSSGASGAHYPELMLGVLVAVLHLDLIAGLLGLACSCQISLALLPRVASAVSRPLWQLRPGAVPAA